MSVTFALEAVSVVLQNPDLGDRLDDNLGQVLAPRSDGQFYRYGLTSAARAEREIGWSNLRADELALLKSFFDSTAQGILNTFTFTDERGNSWTAHFLESVLSPVTVADAISGSASTFTVGAKTYPTTKRTGGVYSVRVRLCLVSSIAAATTTAGPVVTTEPPPDPHTTTAGLF